jgi:putative DNA methylase
MAGRMPALPGEKMNHKNWYSRGYLPHFDAPGLIQGVTFRLYDSLPAKVVEAIQTEAQDDAVIRAKIEKYLNAGHGECYLRDKRIATITEGALHYFDGKRYRLFAWVIMPNHVHVLIEIFDSFPLDKIVHSWKSYTAIEANKLLNRSGKFWYREYFDRYIRTREHFSNAVGYIHENPVKAGLVETSEDWQFSRARLWAAEP